MVSDKVLGKLGRDTIDDMDKMNEDDLRKTVTEASQAMKQVKEELEANADYQELKEKINAMSQGKKEVDARQKARIAYSLHRLEELGKLGTVDRLQFNEERRKYLYAKAEKEAKSNASQPAAK